MRYIYFSRWVRKTLALALILILLTKLTHSQLQLVQLDVLKVNEYLGFTTAWSCRDTLYISWLSIKIERLICVNQR